MHDINWIAFAVFVLLFALITWLGFAAANWRQGDLDLLHEWGLGGRRFGTETPAAQSPFVQEVEIPFPPICGGEAQPCDQGKQQYKDGKCDPVYVVHGIIFPAWLLRSR